MSQLINNVFSLSYHIHFYFTTWILLNFKKLNALLTYMAAYGMAAFSLNTFNKGDQMLCVFNGLFCIPTKCPCFGCESRWFILKPSPAVLTQAGWVKNPPSVLEEWAGGVLCQENTVLPWALRIPGSQESLSPVGPTSLPLQMKFRS